MKAVEQDKLGLGFSKPKARVRGADVAGVIDSTYPLAKAADAIKQLAKGQVAGKIVLTV